MRQPLIMMQAALPDGISQNFRFTFEPCGQILEMSADRGRSAVIDTRSDRRD
jgi:hypothetical protein